MEKHLPPLPKRKKEPTKTRMQKKKKKIAERTHPIATHTHRRHKDTSFHLFLQLAWIYTYPSSLHRIYYEKIHPVFFFFFFLVLNAGRNLPSS